MGFFTNIMSAAIKTALTPVGVVKDTANVLTGKEAEATKNLLKSAAKDANRAKDTLLGENEDGLL